MRNATGLVKKEDVHWMDKWEEPTTDMRDFFQRLRQMTWISESNGYELIRKP
jgi:hypothetical protein